MGFSLIGHKTPDTNNHFLTAESEKMRENIEKNFLETLFLQYSDVKFRDVLMKHFMLFKEAMLYQIFRILLMDKSFYRTVFIINAQEDPYFIMMWKMNCAKLNLL